MPSFIERKVSYKVTFPASPDFSMYLATAELTQKEESHDMLTLYFKGTLTRHSTLPVKKGDPVKFVWKSELDTSTFIGFVHTIEKIKTTGNVFTKVTCINNSTLLKKSSRKVHKNKTADSVVKKIGSELNLTVTSSNHPLTHSRIAQAGQSYWQVLRQLSKQTGFALRAENTEIIFKSKEKIIKDKSSTAPVFVSFNNAPSGSQGAQSILTFNALESDIAPEGGQGDAGMIIYGTNGTKYTFDSEYSLNGTDGEVFPIEDWNNNYGVEIDRTVDGLVKPSVNTAGLLPTPDKTFNIVDYGAKPSKDCTVSIKNAIEAARVYINSNPTKKVWVYIPKGTWNINTPSKGKLKVCSNLVIKCETGAIIKNHGTSYLLSTNNTDYTMTGYNGPTNVTIDGGVWDAMLGAKGMTFIHQDGLTLQNLTIKDHAGNGHAIEINSSKNVTISNCSVLGVKNDGGGKSARDWDEAIQIDFAWTGSTANSGNDGTNCQNVTIDGGVWDAMLGAKGMTFIHQDGLTLQNLTIKDHAGNGHAIEINSSKNVTISNCSVLGVKNDGGGKSARDWDEAIQIDFAWTGSTANSGNDGTNCQNVTITNCTIGPSGTSGSANWPRAIGGHQARAAVSRHTNINILNNTIVGCNSTLGGAIRVYNMRNVLIQGNNLSKCYRAINGYITTESWGGTNYDLTLDNIQIKNNIIDNCGAWKTHANDSTANPAIELNVGSGSGSFSGVTISGNKITNHHGDYGIKVTDSTGVSITGNTVPDRHCVGTKTDMISTTSGTVSGNTPNNS